MRKSVFIFVLFILNFNCCTSQVTVDKFLLSQDEFKSRFLDNENVISSNIVNYKDSSLYLYRNIQRLPLEMNKTSVIGTNLSNIHVVNWIYPLFRKFGYNEGVLGKIRASLFSYQQLNRNYLSIIIAISGSDDESYDIDFYLLNVNNNGALIDGILIGRLIDGVNVDLNDYKILRCNPLDEAPPHILNVHRSFSIENVHISIIEICEILKANYEMLPKVDQTYRSTLITKYRIDDYGFILLE